MTLMLICIAIFVAVFGVMLYSTLKHRKAAEQKSGSHHESVLAEIMWMVLPMIIFFALVWPAAKLMIKS